MIFNTGTRKDLILAYKGTTVTVTLEFPEQPCPRAEEEFTCRLKAICLEKMEAGAGQAEGTPSSFWAMKDKEGCSVG